MSKAYLVMDMPKNCAECSLCTSYYYTYSCIADDHKNFLPSSYASHNATERPNWCPLRELPQKKEKPTKSEAVTCFNSGYNACIDEIVRGSEENG